MGTLDILNSKILKAFTKGSLVVTGLFFVLYFGIIALVLFYCSKCSNNVCESKVWLLIVVLVVPLLVFFIFACLVKLYYEKLYGSNNKEEGAFLTMRKIEVVSEVCLILAKAIKPDLEKNTEALPTLLKEMIDRLLNMSSEKEKDSSEMIAYNNEKLSNSKSNTNSSYGAVVGNKYTCYVCCETDQKN